MVLQRQAPGWWLWARFHRLPHNIVIAVVSTLALRMAILLTLESNGSTIEIEPLWLSFIASLPLVFIFSHETKPDLCAPRSLIRRRFILLASTVITGAIISIVCYPTNLTDFGSVAVFRNILGFLALGFLGRELLGQTRIWGFSRSLQPRDPCYFPDHSIQLFGTPCMVLCEVLDLSTWMALSI